MGQSNNVNENKNGSILGWIGRLILVAVILGITSFLTPGFSINGLWSYLLAAVVNCVRLLSRNVYGCRCFPIWKGSKGICYCSCDFIFSTIFSS